MGWLKERADWIAQWASASTALLSMGCGGLAWVHGNGDLIAGMATLGGVCSAAAVWATGVASKVRDETLDMAIRFSLDASQRLDAGAPQF